MQRMVSGTGRRDLLHRARRRTVPDRRDVHDRDVRDGIRNRLRAGNRRPTADGDPLADLDALGIERGALHDTGDLDEAAVLFLHLLHDVALARNAEGLAADDRAALRVSLP